MIEVNTINNILLKKLSDFRLETAFVLHILETNPFFTFVSGIFSAVYDTFLEKSVFCNQSYPMVVEKKIMFKPLNPLELLFFFIRTN